MKVHITGVIGIVKGVIGTGTGIGTARHEEEPMIVIGGIKRKMRYPHGLGMIMLNGGVTWTACVKVTEVKVPKIIDVQKSASEKMFATG
jgi:hypothetical protein